MRDGTFVIGGRLGGTWVNFGGARVIRWVEPAAVAWSLDPDPLAEAPYIRTATYRRFYHSSWRITLVFYVADELPHDLDGCPVIPDGTVLPGVVVNMEFASSPLCQVCRRHADTPAGNLCVEHLIELLDGLEWRS